MKMAVGSTLNLMKSHLIGKRESVLENLIKECRETKATWGSPQNDFLFALAFWSMAECGFQCISADKNLPKDWKHETRQIYEAQFVLPPYQDCHVKLVALPAGDVLCINVLASNVTRYIGLKSLAIHSPGYVPRPQEDALACKFSGLTDLQFLLKNVIIWPIRCSILTDQGIMNGSLCGLSDEIKLKIVRKLPAPDVLSLSQTCHDLNRICNDQVTKLLNENLSGVSINGQPNWLGTVYLRGGRLCLGPSAAGWVAFGNLWKLLFHSNFKRLCKCSKESEMCDDSIDWKESYKRAYVEKPLEKTSHESTPDSYHTPPDGPYGSEIDLEID